MSKARQDLLHNIWVQEDRIHRKIEDSITFLDENELKEFISKLETI
jgi:hypothetical protein